MIDGVCLRAEHIYIRMRGGLGRRKEWSVRMGLKLIIIINEILISI